MNWVNHSVFTMALSSNRSLTEISSFLWGPVGRRVKQTTKVPYLSRMPRSCHTTKPQFLWSSTACYRYTLCAFTFNLIVRYNRFSRSLRCLCNPLNSSVSLWAIFINGDEITCLQNFLPSHWFAPIFVLTGPRERPPRKHSMYLYVYFWNNTHQPCRWKSMSLKVLNPSTELHDVTPQMATVIIIITAKTSKLLFFLHLFSSVFYGYMYKLSGPIMA